MDGFRARCPMCDLVFSLDGCSLGFCMVRKVVYDCKNPEDAPADAIDGSDELLPEADRVTEANLASELAGALRRIQDRRKREAAKKVSE